jgi:hypothetical protein
LIVSVFLLVQSKRFLLLEPSSKQNVLPKCPQPPPQLCQRRYLFDVGASIYHGWPGHDGPTAVGAKWFVERYASFNMTFDHTYSFEFTVHEPKVVYANLPRDLLSRYTYINVGVEKEQSSAWNLWNFIARIARPIDYVTVKLDIGMCVCILFNIIV